MWIIPPPRFLAKDQCQLYNAGAGRPTERSQAADHCPFYGGSELPLQASVAQSVEQAFRKRQVRGSSPLAGSTSHRPSKRYAIKSSADGGCPRGFPMIRGLDRHRVRYGPVDDSIAEAIEAGRGMAWTPQPGLPGAANRRWVSLRLDGLIVCVE